MTSSKSNCEKNVYDYPNPRRLPQNTRFVLTVHTCCRFDNRRSILMLFHLNYLHTASQSLVVDVFNKAIRGSGLGHRSFLSAAGGSLCCSVAEAGFVPWQLTSGADLTHFVLPISFLWQGSISHVCHRTSPGSGIRKGSVRKWEAISVLCLTMSYLLSMSPLSSTGLSDRHLTDSLSHCTSV